MARISRHMMIYRRPRVTHLDRKFASVGENEARPRQKKPRSKRRSVDLSHVPDKRQEWKIHVRTHSDRVLNVIVNPYDSIDDIRVKVALKEDCSPDQIILLLNGHILHDGFSLDDWHIGDETTLFMSFRLRGGW